MAACGHDASWHACVFFQKGAISGIVREPPVLPTGVPGGPRSFGEPIRLPLPGPVIVKKGCLPPLIVGVEFGGSVHALPPIW